MFKRFLAVVLAVAMVAAFVPAAVANPDIVIGSGGLTTVADIKGAIEAVTGGTVTVTGSMTGVSAPLKLDIPSDVTVVWKATFESEKDFFSPIGTLIGISGGGTFVVADGNINLSDSSLIAILADEGSTVIVSGGTVSAVGDGRVEDGGLPGATAIGASVSSTVTVSGGTVSADGYVSTAISAMFSNVTVSGGMVSAKGAESTAIYAVFSNVTVSDGTVSAEGEKSTVIFAAESNIVINGPITMSGMIVLLEGDDGLGDSSMVIEDIGTLTVPSDGTLTVFSGEDDLFVTVNTTIVNNGTIDNFGTIYIDGGTITNTDEGTINNFGTLENIGKITNEGTIYNYGTIKNDEGTIENDEGTIYSDSYIDGVTTVPLPKTPETSEISFFAYFEPTPPPAPPVSDADTPSDWAQAAVEQARKLGLVPEHLDGSWRRWLNRAEFAAFAVLLYEHLDGRTITAWSLFDDTADVNVEKLAGLGIVKGDGTGKFNPDGNFSREMALTLMYNILVRLGYYLPPSEPSFSDADDISPWAREAIGALQRAGIIKGDGTRFNAQEIFSREMGVVTMAQILEWVG